MATRLPGSICAGWLALSISACGGGGANCGPNGDALCPPLVGDSPIDLTVADFNGDGRTDLVVTDSHDSVLVLFNDAARPGTFRLAQTLTAHIAGNVATGDLNGDGQPDIVVADIDGDGREDVVVTDDKAHTALIYLQDAAAPGTFRAPLSYALPAGSGSAVATAALSGSGAPDVITGGYETVAVLLHDPAHPGHLLPAASYPASSSCAVAVADVNDDGLPDIITDSGASTVNVNGVVRLPPGVLYQDSGRPGQFGALQNLP
jgi:hypothetical protein